MQMYSCVCSLHWARGQRGLQMRGCLLQVSRMDHINRLMEKAARARAATHSCLDQTDTSGSKVVEVEQFARLALEGIWHLAALC